MGPSNLLSHVADVFDDLNIPYFVTGSVATILYGEPRMTQDVDFVADLKPEHVSQFCRCFPVAQFYLSEEAIREALTSFSQFNIIDTESGFKADIIIADRTAFNKQRYERRRRLRVEEMNRSFWFSSPEDVILSKMLFFREGSSDKHLRDITGVLKKMGDKIDRAYIQQWVTTLELDLVWQSVLDRIKQP